MWFAHGGHTTTAVESGVDERQRRDGVVRHLAGSTTGNIHAVRLSCESVDGGGHAAICSEREPLRSPR